jgi:hypothetical protein
MVLFLTSKGVLYTMQLIFLTSIKIKKRRRREAENLASLRGKILG